MRNKAIIVARAREDLHRSACQNGQRPATWAPAKAARAVYVSKWFVNPMALKDGANKYERGGVKRPFAALCNETGTVIVREEGRPLTLFDN